MRKLYLLVMMIFAFIGLSMAQTIDNFESLRMNLTSAGANDSLLVVTNPDTTGINKSLNVVKMERGMDGTAGAGWYATLATAVDVTANPYVHIKVWKSRVSPVVFKYERTGADSGDVLPMQAQTKTNEWEELVFDMSTVSGEYVKIVLFPDNLAPTEAGTLYFDDLYANNDPAVGSAPVQVMEDYEHIKLELILNATNDSSKMILVPNPDPSGINISDYVIEFLRDKDGLIWDGFFSRLVDTIDVTTNKYVHVKVWKPRISVLKFKIEGGAAGTIEIPSMSPQTKTNEWEDIVFDFSAKTGTYPIIAFLPDFNDPVGLTEDMTMYIDDIILNNDPNPLGPPEQVFNVDMTGSGIIAGSKVWISGAFGGVHGTWAEPGTIPENEMLDPDGDGIYSITMQLPDGVYAFKFFWGQGWANGDDAIADRTYTVSGNTNITFVWGVLGYTGARQLSGASFKIFPNPVTNMLTIQSPDMKGLVVSDLLGRTLKNYKFQAVNSKVMDMSDLRSGIYFISVKTSSGTFTSKIIKK